MSQGSNREEYGIVLDYLSHGYHDDNDNDPVVQVVGTQKYKLLELVPAEDAEFELEEEVYIGRGDRPKVRHVKRKLSYDDLTSNAKGELDHAIKQIVEQREDEYVDFFNNAQPISTRSHALQLLPGVGKKHLETILDERRFESFESYEDIADRVSAINDPVDTIKQRVLKEVEGDEKRRLFTR